MGPDEAVHPQAFRRHYPLRAGRSSGPAPVLERNHIPMDPMGNLGDLAHADPGQRDVISQADMTLDGMEPRRTRIDPVMLELETPIDIDPINKPHQQLGGLSMQTVLVKSNNQRACVEHTDETIGPRDGIVSGGMEKSESSR